MVSNYRIVCSIRSNGIKASLKKNKGCKSVGLDGSEFKEFKGST